MRTQIIQPGKAWIFFLENDCRKPPVSQFDEKIWYQKYKLDKNLAKRQITVATPKGENKVRKSFFSITTNKMSQY